MRLYVTDVQLKVVAEFLWNKDVSYFVFADAFSMVKAASGITTWGCVLCPTYNRLGDVELLLEAWNSSADMIQAAIIHVNQVHCLLACPSWAHEHPYVFNLIGKLSGTSSVA